MSLQKLQAQLPIAGMTVYETGTVSMSKHSDGCHAGNWVAHT